MHPCVDCPLVLFVETEDIDEYGAERVMFMCAMEENGCLVDRSI